MSSDSDDNNDIEEGYAYVQCGYVQTGISHEEVKSHVVHFNSCYYDYDNQHFSSIKVGSEVLFYSAEEYAFVRYIEPEHAIVLSVIRTNEDIIFIVDKEVMLPRRKWYRVHVINPSCKVVHIVNHPDGTLNLCITYRSVKMDSSKNIITLPKVVAEQKRLSNKNNYTNEPDYPN